MTPILWSGELSLLSFTMLALVDCDSFFCSCERVFNPRVKNVPVVVLSNNDGCVVSRSREAKAMGVAMCAPYFQIKREFEKKGGVAFSSNFTLYGDFSSRVMSILSEFSPDMEIYSIDEAFLDLSHIPSSEREEFAIKIRSTILKEVGIPVSIGIAATKVLAKVATSLAKKNSKGVFYIATDQQKNNLLKDYLVENLWGVGKASHLKLKTLNIKSAFALMNANPKIILNSLTVMGAKIQQELKGHRSIGLQAEQDIRQQIIVSRSFESGICELDEIKKLLSDHVFNASEILRREGLVCFNMSIFIMTNRFKDLPQYDNSYQIKNSKGEDAPQVLIGKALAGLEQIFRYGYEYKKCGVMLGNLVKKDERQLSFLEPENINTDKITAAIDKINNRYGSHIIKMMSCSTEINGPENPGLKSSRYTTMWDELITIKA
jgi:DNA polymerase V